eukprot:7480531-Ditylum_brightwellii.AAC.1
MLLASLPYSVQQLQEWFADDAALAGYFAAIDHWFTRLCEIGPPRGYIPEPTKSILVTHSKNINNAIEYFDHYNFEIKAGNRYLGGYLGEHKLAQAFATEKVTNWVSSVNTFADMMGQQPQAAFASFARSL